MAWVEIVSAPESELEEEGVQVVPVAVHPLEGVLRVCDDIYRCMRLCDTYGLHFVQMLQCAFQCNNPK